MYPRRTSKAGLLSGLVWPQPSYRLQSVFRVTWAVLPSPAHYPELAQPPAAQVSQQVLGDS